MKKIYICAVLAVLFASCSTEEEGTESTQKENIIQTIPQVNWGTLIDDIEKSSESTSAYSSKLQLIFQVESVAFANADFLSIIKPEYTSPTVSELNEVMTMDAIQLINEMNYSPTAKKYLKELLVDHTPLTVDPQKEIGLLPKEVKLLQFLLDKNNPDEEWNTKKPLAFAYGYQQGAARAVVFTVLANEVKKLKK